VARAVAVRSFVLARNSGDLLPLDPTRLTRIAVLGALAADARVQGGGSAQVTPPHVVAPLDGLTAALPPGVEVRYAVGADPRPRLPAAGGPQWTAVEPAWRFTATLRDHDGEALFRTGLGTAALRWLGDLPPGVPPAALGAIEIAGRYVPDVTGAHTFAINGSGLFRLTVGGKTLFEGPVFPPGADPAAGFFEPGERRVTIELTAGEPVDVELTQEVVNEALAAMVWVTLGHAPPGPEPDELLATAVAEAAAADVAIVVVGTTEEVESEGFDRATLALPGRQDELVARVAAANPRTVVVVNAGAPVELPWAPLVPSILLTWFPGQEAGHALADVLFGAAEPGGRLPTTWPRRASDCPVLSVTPVDGTLAYDEGVFIGYRGWQRSGVAPLFPFGHGLGYTTWAYESLAVQPGDGLGTATVTVRNTGARAGREVVQVYLGPADPDPGRPVRWLAGFAGVTAAPGEAVTVRVPLPERAAQIWQGGWRTVAGRYLVEAGRSVEDRPLSTPLEV
jgi:beta-glucosidase